MAKPLKSRGRFRVRVGRVHVRAVYKRTLIAFCFKGDNLASASWVICQFDHCVLDPINAPRIKFNPYIYILK